jgi:hypothetical protein
MRSVRRWCHRNDLADQFQYRSGTSSGLADGGDWRPVVIEQNCLLDIDRASLEPVVRRALGSPGAEILEWRVEPVGGIGVDIGASALHRVAGIAKVQGASTPWSLVRKLLHPPAAITGLSTGRAVPNHQFYWKREAHAYGSELLQDLPAGLVAPRCHGIDEFDNGIVLWLEDVAEPDGCRWSLERYAEAARHLGRFNGNYLVDRPLPVEPWLCSDMVHWRQAVVAPFWEQLIERRDEPQMRRGWPGEVAGRAHQVWLERERFFTALGQVPQVLSHGDADRRNLLDRVVANGTPETVALDWEFLGPQAVGTDAATLVAQSVLWARDREPDDLLVLSRLCYEGYLTGLREMGWRGDDRLVRLGYTATLSLRFVAMAGAIVVTLASADERPQWEAAFGMTLETILDRHAAMQPFLLDMAEEVRQLVSNA